MIPMSRHLHPCLTYSFRQVLHTCFMRRRVHVRDLGVRGRDVRGDVRDRDARDAVNTTLLRRGLGVEFATMA